MAFALAIFALVMIVYNGTSPEKLTYKQVISFFENDQVKEFKIDSSTLELSLIESAAVNGVTQFKYSLYSPALFLQKIDPYISTSANLEDYDLIPQKGTPFWVSLIPTVLLLAGFLLLTFFMMNRMGGENKAMSFSRARLKLNDQTKHHITYKDVAGADEEKAELEEIVDFLKNPKKYQDMGASIPKGILLVGPPGTGKTYLAKATAGEAGVPFFSISGSDFVELYVGVGASRVRDTFDQAKKNAPCIVFIDEIDAVGRQRGAGLGGGHDEREQTLNQLLVEMDGFEENEGVIVMAATNRPDILDSALLRPGRFDRRITINLPDVKAREQILQIHAANKPMGPDVNLADIAKTTAGFSPAELKNILNESALIAAHEKKPEIDMNDIENAFTKTVLGIEKKSRIISDKDKRITAYHEAGHAIVSKNLPTQDKVQQLSIIPRGMASGYTLYQPKEDKQHMSRTEMFEDIISLLGGRAAEDLCLDDICTGASNDIERATGIAKDMVVKYGMSEKLGPMNFGSNDEVFLGRDFTAHKNYSENTAMIIDEEIKSLVDKAYARAKEILSNNREVLDRIAATLIEKEKLSNTEFEAFFA